MKKFFLIICFIIAGSIMVKAQERPHQREGNGEIPKESSISGTIIDSETNQAVEYASVVVHNTKDSSIITGTITDPKGYFIIEKLSFGKYYIDVDFIGYKKKANK
ncbi:MAG: carboxypeptidase-like regulatory domain-containing protein [Bacteroidota bacterium]